MTDQQGADQDRPALVLVVEDDPILAMQTVDMLDSLGVSDVHSAANVADAMALLDRYRFDLAVLDLKLGEESGLAVAERCFADGISVVFATGYGDLLLPTRYGSERLLRKPYTLEDMERAMRDL